VACQARDDRGILGVNSQIPLTVVIPAYRRERYLEEAVQSVLDNDLARSAYEIVLVADGVTPHLVRKLEDLGVRVITGDAPSVGDMLATGVAAARGEVVAFLDDDDRFHPGKLRTVMEAFADPKLVFYHHAYRRISADGEPIAGPSEFKSGTVRYSLPVPWGGVGHMRRLGAFYNCSSIAVRRRALLPQLPALRKVTNAQDFALFLLLTPPGDALVDGSKVLVDFRTHVSQGTHILQGDALPAAHLKFLEGTVRSFETIREAASTPGGRTFALCREESYDTLLWTMTGRANGNGHAPWIRSFHAILGNIRERDIRNAAILAFLVGLSGISRRAARRFYVPLKRVEMSSLGLLRLLASPAA
jgi:Glycosyl transferase family 2